VISSDRYGGWAVWSVFQVSKQSLKLIRWLTRWRLEDCFCGLGFGLGVFDVQQ